MFLNANSEGQLQHINIWSQQMDGKNLVVFIKKRYNYYSVFSTLSTFGTAESFVYNAFFLSGINFNGIHKGKNTWHK